MADKDFVVKNGLVVNTGFSANSSGLYFSNNLLANSTTINTTTINATTVNANTSGTANNASYLGGTAAAGYQTTAGLSANVATLTANNTSFVGTVSAANVVSNAQLSSNLSNYTTTTALSSNLANYQTTAGLSSNVAVLTANNANNLGGVSSSSYMNTSSSFTRTGVTTFNANVVIGTSAGIVANGGIGTANQVLSSNGSSLFWQTIPVGTASLTANGYSYLPSGLLMQWGNATLPSAQDSTDLAVTMPITFPSAVFMAVATMTPGSGTGGSPIIVVQSLGRSSITFRKQNYTNADNVTKFYWIALGY